MPKPGNSPDVFQWVNGPTVVYPYHGILVSNEKEHTGDTCVTNQMNLQGIMLSEKTPIPRLHVVIPFLQHV